MFTHIANNDNTTVYRIRTEPNWIKIEPYHSNSLYYNGFKTTVNGEVAQIYETEESAEEGHEKWVKKYKKQLESETSNKASLENK